jgi:hypothetical protein
MMRPSKLAKEKGYDIKHTQYNFIHFIIDGSHGKGTYV